MASESHPYAFQAQRCHFLVDGKHAGVIDKREIVNKMPDEAEFDGQSALIWYASEFYLFTRANDHKKSGHRRIQYAVSKDLKQFSRFSLVHFPTIPDDANIYYAHPYVINGFLLLLMPIEREAELCKNSGIYVARGHYVEGEGLIFEKPVLIFYSKACSKRTVDVNCAGATIGKNGSLVLLLHRWVRSRMNPDMALTAHAECFEWWSFNINDILRGPVQLESAADQFFVEARRRRLNGLEVMGVAEDALIDHKMAHQMWLQWQNEWGTSSNILPKDRRCQFNSYCHHTTGMQYCKDVIMLGFQTGQAVGELVALVIAEKDKKGEKLSKATCKKTLAQIAKKARRRHQYALLKARDYCQQNNICMSCQYENDCGQKRNCKVCFSPQCLRCMLTVETVCRRCLREEGDERPASQQPSQVVHKRARQYRQQIWSGELAESARRRTDDAHRRCSPTTPAIGTIYNRLATATARR